MRRCCSGRHTALDEHEQGLDLPVGLITLSKPGQWLADRIEYHGKVCLGGLILVVKCGYSLRQV